jgi:hypothetical protein
MELEMSFKGIFSPLEIMDISLKRFQVVKIQEERISTWRAINEFIIP